MDSMHGSGEGHEASTPRVYASDEVENTIGHYGCAIDPFRDGMFYSFGWIISAKHTRCRHEKHTGTIWHDIAFPAAEVDILGLVVLPDVQPEAGTARFHAFNLEFETIPQGEWPPPPRCAWQLLAGP